MTKQERKAIEELTRAVEELRKAIEAMPKGPIYIPCPGIPQPQPWPWPHQPWTNPPGWPLHPVTWCQSNWDRPEDRISVNA